MESAAARELVRSRLRWVGVNVSTLFSQVATAAQVRNALVELKAIGLSRLVLEFEHVTAASSFFAKVDLHRMPRINWACDVYPMVYEDLGIGAKRSPSRGLHPPTAFKVPYNMADDIIRQPDQLISAAKALDSAIIFVREKSISRGLDTLKPPKVIVPELQRLAAQDGIQLLTQDRRTRGPLMPRIFKTDGLLGTAKFAVLSFQHNSGSRPSAARARELHRFVSAWHRAAATPNCRVESKVAGDKVLGFVKSRQHLPKLLRSFAAYLGGEIDMVHGAVCYGKAQEYTEGLGNNGGTGDVFERVQFMMRCARRGQVLADFSLLDNLRGFEWSDSYVLRDQTGCKHQAAVLRSIDDVKLNEDPPEPWDVSMKSILVPVQVWMGDTEEDIETFRNFCNAILVLSQLPDGLNSTLRYRHIVESGFGIGSATQDIGAAYERIHALADATFSPHGRSFSHLRWLVDHLFWRNLDKVLHEVFGVVQSIAESSTQDIVRRAIDNGSLTTLAARCLAQLDHLDGLLRPTPPSLRVNDAVAPQPQPATAPAPVVSICYFTEDRPRVVDLNRLLNKRGYIVHWDAQWRAGEDYDEAFKNRLRESDVCIVLWSKFRRRDEAYVFNELHIIARWMRLRRPGNAAVAFLRFDGEPRTSKPNSLQNEHDIEVTAAAPLCDEVLAPLYRCVEAVVAQRQGSYRR